METGRRRDALKSEKDAVAFGIFLLVHLHGAVNHGNNAVAELYGAGLRENLLIGGE